MSDAARPDPPIPNSYWVRPGQLAAGEYPGERRRRDATVKVRTQAAPWAGTRLPQAHQRHAYVRAWSES